MNLLFRPTAAVLSIFLALGVADTTINNIKSAKKKSQVLASTTGEQKIQAAILLDVSGSMNGLIEQAKAQLWNMVSVMGKVKCENGDPRIEIALYEYGRTTNDQARGYIKQISPFTSDLDQLSQELFKLQTDGGDEYCGQVIKTSLDELAWDPAQNNYKVIFIAGNEDFLQGNILWTDACKAAKEKGVIVNTIYCGDREMGIREHWNLAGECGNGSYSHIDHNAKELDIPTPYDSVLLVWNDKLNNTYVRYGSVGEANYAKQATVDKLNAGFQKEAMAKRVEIKSQKKIYNNSSWDLVDAMEKDKTIIEKIDRKTLPDSLSVMSAKELKEYVSAKTEEREMIRKEIANVSKQRQQYITAEKAKAASENTSTLETEVERAIRQQVKRFNMMIETKN